MEEVMLKPLLIAAVMKKKFTKWYGFLIDHLESSPCNQIRWLAVKTGASLGVVCTRWVSALMKAESKKMENGSGNGEGPSKQKKGQGQMSEFIENDFVEG